MLLGENGAGKSTLIKVLSGAYTRDEGTIFVEGRRVEIHSPVDPLELGLRFIYQELNLVPQLDIARNMFLGDEPRRLGFVRQRQLYDEAARYLERFHMNLDPRAIVGRLSVTQQKLVEIARALVREAKVLVLDEPTDVLEDRSRQDLFDVIRDLKKTNHVGFIYISHRYSEVHQLGDRVTILRDGRNEGTYRTSEITLDQIIEKMIGRRIEAQYPQPLRGGHGRGPPHREHPPEGKAEGYLPHGPQGGDRERHGPHGRGEDRAGPGHLRHRPLRRRGGVHRGTAGALLHPRAHHPGRASPTSRRTARPSASSRRTASGTTTACRAPSASPGSASSITAASTRRRTSS